MIDFMSEEQYLFSAKLDEDLMVKECMRLYQDNQQLKIKISAREEEYKKLEDNWNKLKLYLLSGVSNKNYIINENCMLSKMQELERGVSDVED